VKIETFAVEQWMNEHETTARWNMGETCVDSLRLDELLALSGDPEAALRELAGLKLTYGDIPGSAELRSRIAELYQEGPRPGTCARSVTADDVLVTGGAIEGNFLVFFALVEPGDTVISVAPTYQQLYSIPEGLGAKTKTLELQPENGFLPDPGELRRLVDGKTRLICLNNPNNPTGALTDEALLRELLAVADECGAYVLCDEVYRGLEHEPGTTAPSVVSLYERGISTGSMSKVFSLAGLRTGWIGGPPEVIALCQKCRDYTTISCGLIDDRLSALALAHRDRLLERNLAIVRENAQLLDEWIAGEPHLDYVKPRAGTTAFIHYDFPVGSRELFQAVFDATGAFVVPGECFDREGWLRVGYASSRYTLEGGLAAISSYFKELERTL
jgi:aspartate/methionine/tyrosine aminotransferase